MTDRNKTLEHLIEAARLLGITQAKKGYGVYTIDDGKVEGALHESIDKYKAALAQPEQEPVAWKYDWYGHKSAKEPRVLVKDWIASVYTEVSDPTINAHNIRPLYAAPPKREWVGLTSEDWENTPDTGKQGCERDVEIFDWIEQTLKEKNT